MEPILPLHHERIRQFCGAPVCVILKNGRRHVGILHSCREDALFLNGPSNYIYPRPVIHSVENSSSDSEVDISTKSKKKRSKTKATVKNNFSEPERLAVVQTKAYAPYGYGRGYGYGYGFPYGAAAGFDLASIAFLLLLL